MGLADNIYHQENTVSVTSSSSSDIMTEKLPSPHEIPHAEHGAPIDHVGPQEEVVHAQPDLWWSRTRHTLREPLSEFFGTFILIMFGDGVVAQVVLSKGEKGMIHCESLIIVMMSDGT